jgi:hypothetical protein
MVCPHHELINTCLVKEKNNSFRKTIFLKITNVIIILKLNLLKIKIIKIIIQFAP